MGHYILHKILASFFTVVNLKIQTLIYLLLVECISTLVSKHGSSALCQMWNVMKICPVGAELFRADRKTDGRNEKTWRSWLSLFAILWSCLKIYTGRVIAQTFIRRSITAKASKSPRMLGLNHKPLYVRLKQAGNGSVTLLLPINIILCLLHTHLFITDHM
jgi:hypothetical protein